MKLAKEEAMNELKPELDAIKEEQKGPRLSLRWML